MRLLFLVILLAFPVLELVLLIQLAEHYGWWLLDYLLLSAACGLWLLREERRGALPRMMDALRAGQHPVRSLLTSARKVVAGILLILPGVLSDLFALLILLVPVPRMQSPSSPDDGAIEGEWRRED